MVSDLTSSSNRKLHRISVKMLIAQELSNNLESDQKSTNLVAKLMGLDAIPLQNPKFPSQRRIQSRLSSRNSHSEIPTGYWKDDRGFNKKIDCEVHSRIDRNEYKDIYDILQQSNCKREKASRKGRSNENFSERKLELIREKFMEAKCLATDEKLRETREFQEALDVLSSNKDLFLKVLQERNNYLVSQHLYIEESISPFPEKKRITVLKPSKTMSDGKFGAPMSKRCEKQVKNQVLLNRVNVRESQNHGFPPTIQPTQIVVLKPGPGKSNESKARIQPGEKVEDEEAREVAKEITQQMREHLAGHSRDETLISSVLSNGYRADESSVEKSENEMGPGNLSDFEVISPISRHSWDYVDRDGSPLSSVSFGRAYSLESSVCREAKRRLSERWAMVVSHGNNNNNKNNINFDQGHIRRSSSTLGEMLALSEVKKPEICEEKDNKDRDQMGSSSSPSSNMDPRESGNLSRSKSVPVSCTGYGERLNMNIIKPKTSKTSFTGKVTNLFFSRNKKSKKDNPRKSSSNNESQLSIDEVSGFVRHSTRTSNDHSESVLSPTSRSQEVILSFLVLCYFLHFFLTPPLSLLGRRFLTAPFRFFITFLTCD